MGKKTHAHSVKSKDDVSVLSIFSTDELRGIVSSLKHLKPLIAKLEGQEALESIVPSQEPITKSTSGVSLVPDMQFEQCQKGFLESRHEVHPKKTQSLVLTTPVAIEEEGAITTVCGYTVRTVILPINQKTKARRLKRITEILKN